MEPRKPALPVINTVETAFVETAASEDVAAPAEPSGDWKMTVEEFSFAGCHYNSSCD